MNIAGVEIGSGHPCRTIAEISCNHGGSFDRCIRLFDAAKEAGADLLKVQAYTPDELVALRGDGPAPAQWGEQGWTMHALYTKAMTPREWFPDLFEHAERIRLPLFASVFGAESLALLESLGCPAYKIASLDREARGLREMIKATDKAVLQSLPHHLRGLPHNAWWTDDVEATLYCPPGYPQASIALQDMFWYDGLSYHGTDELVPVYAVVAGAHLIECHIQLDDEPSELEQNISLTTSQFASMVTRIRAVETML